MFRPLSVLLFALLVAFFPTSSPGAESVSDPAALQVFDSALTRLEAKNVSLRKWQYFQTLTTQQLDSDGHVVGTGVWRSIFRPGSKDPIEYLSEKKEGKLTFFEDNAAKADPKKTAKSDAAAAREEDADSPNRIESLADAIRKFSLRDRYLWKSLPDETAAGENAYVISFTPKPDQPVKTKMQRFLGLLTGKIWISREDFSVLKTEGSLTSPYHLLWIIAQVGKVDFTYEVDPDPANRLLRTSHAEAETIVTFPFNTIHQKHSLLVEKYEPRTVKK